MATELVTGDMREVLASRFPSEHFHCCVTSPPYWRQRKYRIRNTSYGDWEGQLGLEQNPDDYVKHLVLCMRAVKRVLRDDGVLWLNLGDCYAGGGRKAYRPTIIGARLRGESTITMSQEAADTGKLDNLDLVGVPWRFALAMQADGWILRSAIVWVKGISFKAEDIQSDWEGGVMPENLKGWRWEPHRVKTKSLPLLKPDYKGRPQHAQAIEGRPPLAEWKICPGCAECTPHGGLVLRKAAWRPIAAHELIFMFTRSSSYFCDAEAMREAGVDSDKWEKSFGTVEWHRGPAAERGGIDVTPQHSVGRNPRDVWALGTQGVRGKHYATFPPSLPSLCIRASAPEACCSSCGAPYVAVVEAIPRAQKESRSPVFCLDSVTGRDVHIPTDIHYDWRETGDRRPSCNCRANKPTVPGRVLDPFGGTGTTGIAAFRMGRDCVCIDLGEKYTEMAQKRLRSDE